VTSRPAQGRETSVAADSLVPLLLSRPPRLGPVRLVAVDGPAGSGKTTLAGALAAGCAAAGATAQVVHLDDLYAGWSGLEGDLWPRLAAQVLEPLRRGRPGRYQRYDWVAERFDDWVDVPVADVLVLEGCGSGRRDGARDIGLLVWVQADDRTRLARGLARDGADALPQWEQWMADESAHYAREGTRGRADVRVDAWGRMAR
jgi:uridine kinase